MAAFQRIVTFRCNNLGAPSESYFILTFDDPQIPGIYKDVFPTVFKITAFGATGPYTFTVVYNSQLGFTRAQHPGGIIIPASTYTPIGVGQKTTLTATGLPGRPKVYSFSAPQNIGGNNFIAVNGTDELQDFGLGFFERPDREPSQILVFEGVGAGSSVPSEFTPVLRGYMTSDYQENVILRGEIRSPILFDQNLAQLQPNTNWIITFNPSNRKYEITRDLSRDNPESRIAVDEN